MKMLWCWRCKIEMPMLDEDEYARVQRARGNRSSGKSLRESLHGSVLDEYERITGYRETNPNAIFHHRLSLYGPPCEKCGRPLRTPQAKLCGACMHPVRQA